MAGTQRGGRRLTIPQILTPEQVEEAKKQPVLSIAQLHMLKQQIESLKRINLQLKILKHRKRTGQDLAPGVNPLRRQILGGVISVDGGRRQGGGRQSGGSARKSVGKRRSSPEVEVVDADEHVSVESGSDTDGEVEVSDYETPEDSDIETAVAALPRQGQGSARRTSGRRRTTVKSLKECSSSSSDDDAGVGKGGEQRSAGHSLHGQHGGQPTGRQSTATSTAGGSRKQQRRRSIMVVQDDAASSVPGILLPKFNPVTVHWPSSIDDALCSVCGDGEDAEGNQVLLCDGAGCSVAVHQQCYGVPRVPKGKWLCDACKAGLSPAQPNCACCPVVGGAVRKVVALGRVVPQGPGAYVHVACALWTPEITLAEPGSMRGVQLDHMTGVRAELQCGLCKQGGGAVVQCDFTNCCRPFHVMCGRASGNLLTFRETDGFPLAFCGLHSGERFERTRDGIIEGKSPLYAVGEGESEMDLEEDDLPKNEQPQTEYELQRSRNIERNKQVLAELRGNGQ